MAAAKKDVSEHHIKVLGRRKSTHYYRYIRMDRWELSKLAKVMAGMDNPTPSNKETIS